MKNYKVVDEAGVKIEGSERLYEKDTVIVLDAETEETKTLVANGIVVEVVEENPIAQTQVPGTPDATITPEPVVEVVTETVPAEEIPSASAEPQKRYRGQLVLSDTMRTVGEQTFHALRLEDGTEMDLTDAEYVEVHVSYPPEA